MHTPLHTAFDTDAFRSVFETLSATPCPDDPARWPTDRLQILADGGIMKWNLPREFGGLELDDSALLEGYRHLASACLVTTFILTQRNAACLRIGSSSNSAVRLRLLPALAENRLFATVGISHLTTSGQHLRTPPVEAVVHGEGFRLTGTVPWATGAENSDLLVTGGQLDDGRQILAALPPNRVGLEVNPPVNLMALNSSRTGSVSLMDVEVSPDDLLHGPVTAVMQHGAGGGAGSLGTSALAAGATEGMLRRLSEEVSRRPDLRVFVESLRESACSLVEEIRAASRGKHPAGTAAAETVRRQANSLVLRTAQSWLAATKGAGYVAGHPAERAVRESMFFLVWSCPQPVLTANLRELACVSSSQPSGSFRMPGASLR